MAEPKACLEPCGHDRRFVVQNPVPNGWKPGLGSGNPMADPFWEGQSEGPEIPQTDPSTIRTSVPPYPLVIKQYWEFPHSQHGVAITRQKWLGKSWEFPAKELIDGETVLQDAILVGLGSL